VQQIEVRVIGLRAAVRVDAQFADDILRAAEVQPLEVCAAGVRQLEVIADPRRAEILRVVVCEGGSRQQNRKHQKSSHSPMSSFMRRTQVTSRFASSDMKRFSAPATKNRTRP
jgi:hypothetical protein